MAERTLGLMLTGALRIEKAFGVSTNMPFRMQAWYDEHAIRVETDPIHINRFRPRHRRTPEAARR